jgi:hypothetical protein
MLPLTCHVISLLLHMHLHLHVFMFHIHDLSLAVWFLLIYFLDRHLIIVTAFVRSYVRSS